MNPALLLILLASPLAAQQVDTTWQSRLDSLIARGVREQRVPGLAVGLAPLGMSTSTLLHTNVDTTLLAQGYTRPREKPAAPFRRVTYPFNRKHGPSSDLFSSVVDMSRWARANLNRGELDGRQYGLRRALASRRTREILPSTGT
jgi:hypothetical protein